MTAQTAARHIAAELRYTACDDTTGIVHFQAASASIPDKVNTVSYDTITGATHCDCAAALIGTHTCWHADLAPLAWARHPAMQDVRWLTDARLTAYGRKLAGMVAAYRARAGRVLPADALNLLAARAEWRQRAAVTAPVPLASFQIAVAVAA